MMKYPESRLRKFVGYCLVILTAILISMISPFNCQADLYNQHLQDINNQQPDKFFLDQINYLNQAAVTPAQPLAIDQQTKQYPPPLSPAPALKSHYFFKPDPVMLKKLTKLNKAADFDHIFARELHKTELLTLVFLRNSKIKAAKDRLDAARQAIRQVENLDAVLRQYAAFTSALSNGVGPMKEAMVQEKFPFPAVAALKGQIARQAVIIAQENLEISRRSALVKCEQEFWNLYYNHQAQKLTAEMSHLLEHLESVARSRYQTGKAGFQELIQVQITLEEIRDKQTTLHRKQKSLEANLKQLLDLGSITEMGLPVIDPSHLQVTSKAHDIPISTLDKLAQDNRQEIRIAKAQITRMELLIDLAESMILPPFTLNLADFSNKTIQQVGSGAKSAAFKDDIKAQVGAGLPRAPWFGTNDPYIESSRHILLGQKAMLADLQAATKADIFERWFQLDKASRNVTLYHTKIVDLSQAALDVVTQGYETGETPFAQVNISYQNWLNSRLALAKSKSDLGIAMSRLQERLGIKDLTNYEQ